ncbi:MAG: hypothetical protein ACD_47C00697G0002 [uncultured bacterium]|uniref:PpiC domain-containing protein n=1 Tax=Candidatus Wallbacteria bacterium GWC2_49_35 TaxID=1817813 RepID=A0A1F7WWB0_9BACT|nr:MAG: hypothetical protein ACD_47C00697G0002 [uncultured bacterium]OGM06458.1 MAG: hypothetical protein A2008_05255 [Candidatus Wallbacteria bacterium GWC2_49_35]HBC76556.1 hypothetical protein [Candidatus Wallbacteria bacterium]
MRTENSLRENIILLALMLLIAAVFYNMSRLGDFERRAELRVTNAREFAAKLASQKLYHEAAAHIEKYLNDNLVAPEELEATQIYLADLYFENIGNFEKAMAAYLKVLYLFPASKYKNDIDRRVIECKDRLGRRLEAANDLESIKEKEKKPAGAPPATAENSLVVAKIGDLSITMADYLGELDSLFAGSGADISKPENRVRLLKEVIIRKVLLKIARAKRLDSDAQILKNLNSAKDKMMIDKLLNEEVFSKTAVDDMSMQLYYDAHKNEMRTPDKYKFDYITLTDRTEAVSIASAGDAAKFASYASRQTTFSPLGEIAASMETDIFSITGEIALARPGDIVKVPAARSDGTFAVMKLTNYIAGDILPFESVKDGIKQGLTAQKRENDLQNYVMKNFAEMNVVIFDDVFKKESGEKK